MSIERIHKLLNSSRNHIKINTDLLKIMDTDEAILYSYLVPMFQKNLKQQDFRFFNDELFVPYKTELIEAMTGLSAFKQRNALNRLQKKNLLKVKLGQARTKFISINENVSVLENLLYGLSLSAIEQCLFKCYEAIEEQAQNTNRPAISREYFMNNMKNSDIFNSFSELGIGWLLKETEKKREEDELLCV